MKSSIRLFSFFGVPVWGHFSLLLAFLFSYAAYENIVDCILSGVSFITLMLIHEIGHAFFVRRYDHELVEIRLYPLHGLCDFYAISRPENWIIAGGLLAQALLFVFWFILLQILNLFGLKEVEVLLAPVTFVFIPINFATFIFNLLPIAPLDGYELWKRFVLFVSSSIKQKWKGFAKGAAKKRHLRVVKDYTERKR